MSTIINLTKLQIQTATQVINDISELLENLRRLLKQLQEGNIETVVLDQAMIDALNTRFQSLKTELVTKLGVLP